jgi:hypothetical protein
LLAAARIAPGGLQMALGVGADPHVGIGRRDGEGVDPLDFVGVGQALAVAVEILEPAPQFAAAQARLAVINVVQVTGQVGRHGGVGHGAKSLAINQAGMAD